MLAAAPVFHTPLILLAAVHHLLLSGADDALGAYYGTVAGDDARPVDEQLYPTFAGFVDAHRPEIEALVATHSTQTNEVGRTAITLPAFGLVASESGRPLALLEVGASAGLNLLLDRFGFRIGAAQAGDQRSPVQLRCATEGDLRPPVPDRLEVAWRLGADLNPLNIRDDATRDWLRALVWPEHRDRMAQLDAALELARAAPPLLVQGDLTTDVVALGTTAPEDIPLVVVSTWVLAYVAPELRRAFIGSLGRLAAERGDTVWLVAGEGQSVIASLDLDLVESGQEGYGPSLLAVARFDPDGAAEARMLAECHAHGRWIRWLHRETGLPAGRSA